MIFVPAIFALLVTLALALARAFAANAIGTISMLLLAILEFYTGRPEFTDLALVYGLLNIIGTVAVLKFFRGGDLGEPADEAGAR
jgi:multicomponent Na+:H+ antiporter subunit F